MLGLFNKAFWKDFGVIKFNFKAALALSAYWVTRFLTLRKIALEGIRANKFGNREVRLIIHLFCDTCFLIYIRLSKARDMFPSP